MTDATELDEAAIRARMEAATPGPWFGSGGGKAVYGATVGDLVAEFQRGADATFVRHARTDVERLLAALDETRAERDKAQRAAKTLGGIVEQNARMILDITGLHDWIDEDGDGDWGAVWDNAYELLPRANAAEAQVERLHFDLDREAHARQAAEQERDEARNERDAEALRADDLNQRS